MPWIRDANGKLVNTDDSGSVFSNLHIPSLDEATGAVNKALNNKWVHKLLIGETDEERAARKGRELESGVPPEYAGKPFNAGLNPVTEKSILPELPQPESYWKGFGKSLYDDFVKPLATPSGVLGSSGPRGIKTNAAADAAHRSVLDAVDKGYPVDPRPVPIETTPFGPKGPSGLELPPAPESVTNPRRTFISGPKGVSELGRTYPMDIAPLKPGLGEQGVGTVLPREVEGLSDIPALDAPRLGTTLGEIPSISPEALEGMDPQAILGRLESTAKEGSPIRISDSPEYNIGRPDLPYELPSAEVKLKSAIPEAEVKPNAKPAVEAPAGNTTTQAKPVGMTNPKFTDISGDYRAIPDTATPEEAMQQWANGRNGAKTKGNLISQLFSDLKDDTSLIDKYEKGDRSGRLADVQKYLDQRLGEGKAAGMFKDDQEIINYLRHEYEQNPEEVAAAVKQFVAKNPSIAKTRRFPTYAEAEASGLKRKYTNIPDLLDAYEQKFQQGMRNKELYNYLEKTGQKAPGGAIDSMSEWKFKGPNKDKFIDLMGNVLQKPSGAIKKTADFVSVLKNLYLGGGIPKTKYNMHAFNVARSDAKLAGFWKAGKEFFTDPTGKAGEAFLKDPANAKDLADLVDHGYTYHPVEDIGGEISGVMGKGKVGKAFDKVVEAGHNTFEKPLFEKALPALKLKRTIEVLEKLEPEMGREKALNEAARIGNEFYGGINKVLRDKNVSNSSRIIFLAPDWLESRLRLAKRDYTGLAKTLVGKGDEVSKIGAKSAARGMAIGGASALGAAYLRGDEPLKRASDVMNLELGNTDVKNRQRSFNPIGTSDEGVKIPIESAIRMYQGDPGALIDLLIKNKLSTPLKTTLNVVKGEDDFGNPLKGKDKYGRQISGGQAIVNYLSELSKPMQYQFIQGMLKYANGDASLEEALATGLELPLNYHSEGQKKKLPKGAPRIKTH